jgi:uncharacterized protein
MWSKILIVILVFIFILTLIIKRFVYFRPGFSFESPRENFLDIYEGNLHAWFRNGTNDKVILFCHGNTGNLSQRQDKLIELIKLGYSVLIFDYSGYGHSKGVPNEDMCYSNVDIFFNYLLRKGFHKDNIIPYGESLGSAIASYIARKYKTPILIIESGIPGIKHIIKKRFKVPLLDYVFNEFDTISFLRGYSGRILTLHCINDEIVPYEYMEEMKSLSTQFIDMDGSHNNPEIPYEEIHRFIKQYS